MDLKTQTANIMKEMKRKYPHIPDVYIHTLSVANSWQDTDKHVNGFWVDQTKVNKEALEVLIVVAPCPGKVKPYSVWGALGGLKLSNTKWISREKTVFRVPRSMVSEIKEVKMTQSEEGQLDFHVQRWVDYTNRQAALLRKRDLSLFRALTGELKEIEQNIEDAESEEEAWKYNMLLIHFHSMVLRRLHTHARTTKRKQIDIHWMYKPFISERQYELVCS
jgi:hypothetical protein